MRPFIIIGALLVLFSCKKDRVNTSSSAALFTSSDTIKFDTVFTSLGSVTQSFRIYNPNEERLILSSIKLEGGSASSFTININGMPLSEASQVEIAARDSIHVFVKVTIDPSISTLPFVIRDSISINYNGNVKLVQLESYGQNAVFIRDSVLTGINNWNNNLPYVILGSLRIDTTSTLNIQAGSRIYLDARASFIVDGNLNATGTETQRISFLGNRLDEPYRNFPGTWAGLIFRNTSGTSSLKYCNILNAYQGIAVAGKIPSPFKLSLEQCVIDNCYDAGIVAVNANVSISNTLISNCGSNLNILQGGNYLIEHCTMASYSNNFMEHTRSSVYVSDHLNINGVPIVETLNATFTNSIFWGEGGMVENEISTSRAGNNFNLTLNNCIYKATSDPEAVINNSIRNIDPQFDSIDAVNRYFDFHTSPFSPALDAGMPTSWPFDLDGNARNLTQPDIGCYEMQ